MQAWTNCPSPSLLSSLPISPPLLTGGDDALQADDVGVVKLSQDAGLAEEGTPLFVGAAGPQGLDGHGELSLTGQLQAAATHLPKVTYGEERDIVIRGSLFLLS